MLGLPVLLQKADLLHGFDLVWRDAVKVHLAQAGVKGKLWLYTDSSLQVERLRVRVGALVGEMASLTGFGVGQGGRAGVDLFSAMVRPLQDMCAERAIGVGVDVPGMVADAYCRIRDDQLGFSRDEGHAAAAFIRLHGTSSAEATLSAIRGNDTRLACLDLLAPHRFLHLQFVDDTFNMISSVAELREVNGALSDYCELWRHRFQGGAKRPTVLAIGSTLQANLDAGTICGEAPSFVDCMDVLGIPLDRGLTMQPLLDRLCSKMENGARELCNNITALGFGLPYLCAQFPSRVESSALFGCELLASYAGDWAVVARKLNDLQYRAAKILLGVRVHDSWGPGGHVRALCETRFFRRLSSKVALRIILSRARLLALPTHNPVGSIVSAALGRTGPSWLDHARVLTAKFAVYPDFLEFYPLDDLQRNDPSTRRKAVSTWKHKVVLPRIKQIDEEWFQAQLDALPADGFLSYVGVAPSRVPFSPGLVWAPWGPTTWRFFRAWCVARATSCLPLPLWECGRLVSSLPVCPLCGGLDADLVHILAICPNTRRFRTWEDNDSPPAVSLWVLRGSGDPQLLHSMVSQLGLSMAAVADAMARPHIFP